MPTNSPETQTFVLKVQASDRSLVDREMERVRDCVIPIVGENRERPYPATATKRHDKTTLETPMEVMSHLGTLEAYGTLSVVFDKKEGARRLTGHGDPRAPYGKSGGAIFAMRAAGRVVRPGQSAKLAGISLEWRKREKRVVGAGIFILKRLLDAAIATAGDDGANDSEDLAKR